MTNADKNDLREYVRVLILDGYTDEEIIRKSIKRGYKKGTIKKYIQIFK